MNGTRCRIGLKNNRTRDVDLIYGMMWALRAVALAALAASPRVAIEGRVTFFMEDHFDANLYFKYGELVTPTVHTGCCCIGRATTNKTKKSWKNDQRYSRRTARLSFGSGFVSYYCKYLEVSAFPAPN